MHILLEACCGSAEDVIEAAAGGAERAELNSDLFHGGLTPTVGELAAAKAHTDIPIMTMIRPRQGGFCYTDVEYETAKLDAAALLERGADGLVFGFLTGDGEIDVSRTRELVSIAEGRQTVFHRAIDVVPDWRRALDTLIGLGVTRVLTSGQAPDVFFALDTVREMLAYAGDAIQILPGAGITAENARRVAEYTGARQLHMARHREAADRSTANNRDIFFGGALYPPEDRYPVSDRGYFAETRASLDRLE